MEVNKALGMVIGGRAARACDVCGHERARWYCAADEAYLCERCDSSVHSANAVAKRHDRVRLGPNGAPMKIERSSTGVVKRELSFRSAHRGSRRRPRSSRHHPPRSRFTSSRSAETNLGNPQLADVKVKPEPSSPEPEGQVPENHLLESLFDSKELPGDAVLHEVPIYMSMDQELPVFDYADPLELKPANEISNQVSVDQPRDAGDPDDESLDLLVPDNCIDIDCFLDEGGDLCDLEVDMDCMAGQNDESLCVDGIGMFSLCDSRGGKGTCYDLDSSDHRVLNVDSDCHSDREYEEVYQNGESPRSWLCKVKVESPPPDLGATELVEADAILGQKLEGCRSEGRPKLGLRLNFEDVLNAWSDRGSLWMNGQRPQVVPDESSLDYLEGLEAGLVPDLSFNSSCSTLSGDHLGLVPVIKDATSSAKSEAREARVMRYREKRRTRLFSKKIRYEVRKLNAEKRPRMKGRFVKRTSPAIPT